MNTYVQAIAMVLLSSVLVLILRHSSKGVGELLSILVCAMVIAIALEYIRPVADFLNTLKRITSLNDEMIKSMMKAVGISITTEIASLISEDSGNSAMGKSLQLLATVMIAGMMIPMLNQLLKLIEGVLSAI